MYRKNYLKIIHIQMINESDMIIQTRIKLIFFQIIIIVKTVIKYFYIT